MWNTSPTCNVQEKTPGLQFATGEVFHVEHSWRMSHNEIIKSYLPLALVICLEQADTDLQPGAENDTVSHFTHVYQSTTPVYVIVAPVLAGAILWRAGL